MANLSVSVAASGGLSYNLTSLGSVDWLAFDGSSNITPLRKSSGTAIAFAIISGTGGSVAYSRASGPTLTYTDGTAAPTSSSTQGGIYITTSTGLGWTYTVPADTTTRRLHVYAGIYAGAGVKVTATLSDGSAAQVIDSSWMYTSGTDPTTAEYVIDFAAGSAGQTLTVRVEGVNGGTLSIQGAAYGLPPAITAPDAPTIGTASAGNGTISVTFTPPANNGGAAITSYTVSIYKASDNSFIRSLSGSSSPVVITGLTNGVAIYVKVAATNSVNTGAQSAASNTVTPTNVNSPPTESGTIADISGQAGVALTPVDVHSYFSDSDALTYSASPAGTAWPSGLVINSATGVISGTVAAAGTTSGLKVRATDTASQTVDSPAFAVVISSGPQQVPYNDAAITFSPGTWDDRGTYKSANTPGAYAKLSFSGTSVTAKFDVSYLSAASTSAGSYPIVRMVIDGKFVTDTQLGSSTPDAVVTGLAGGQHTVEMYFRAIDVNLTDRWGVSSGAQPTSALVFKGFTLDAGAAYSAVTARSKSLLWWGDSISEGYIVNAAANPSGNNAQGTVVPFIAQALGCEYGQIGYSAQGYEKTGNGGVPALYSATPANSPINFFSNGRSRLVNGVLSPAPDYICVMHGANGTPTSTGVGGVVDLLRSIAPNAKIFILVPAGGYARAAITPAVTARSADTKLFLIDLGTDYQLGMDSSGNGGQYSNDNGLHPNLLGNAKAATGYLPKVQSALDGVAAVVAPTLTARTVSVTLATGLDANSQPILAASLSGLKVAFYDEATPDLHTAPRYKSAGGSTTSGGVLSFVVQSTLASGGTGCLVVQMADGRNFVMSAQVS